MRLQFDELYKQLLTAAFAPADRVERNAELDALDAQKVDLLIEPRPEGDAARAQAGLPGRLFGEGPCQVEHFSSAPSTDATLESVRKLLTARRKTPRLRSWLLSAGRPDTAMAELGFMPDAREVLGVYRLEPGWATGLVVLSELPEGPDTLLLRLLGRGATFRAALREFTALPSGAWLREVALPILARLRIEVRAATVEDDRMSDETEALMATGEQVYQEWERRTREQGRAEALQEAEQRFSELERRIREQGRAEALQEAEQRFSELERRIREQGRAEALQEAEQRFSELERHTREQGRAEGQTEGLRAAISDLCDVFGIELGPERQGRLAAMGLAELEALRAALKQHRSWPEPR
jgi:hypothetical protein